MDAIWGLGVTLGDFGVSWKHLGVTWGSPWSTLGPLEGQFGTLLVHCGALWGHYFWVYEGCFGVTVSDVQKTLIFPMNFNDFI